MGLTRCVSSSPISSFILVISEPSSKGVLQGEETGWASGQTRVNLFHFRALTRVHVLRLGRDVAHQRICH